MSKTSHELILMFHRKLKFVDVIGKPVCHVVEIRSDLTYLIHHLRIDSRIEIT